MVVSYPYPEAGDEFKRKRVLIIGGTKGMGETVVRRFVLTGAAVAMTTRSPQPATQSPARFVQADATSWSTM
jgi:NAD(P)-dependent dehydrogenase (short-subunit alcohol dehydrogenase family)